MPQWGEYEKKERLTEKIICSPECVEDNDGLPSQVERKYRPLLTCISVKYGDNE